MRRAAAFASLTFAGLLAAASCSEKVLLPGAVSNADGSSGNTGGAGAVGPMGQGGQDGGIDGPICTRQRDLNPTRTKGNLLLSVARGSSMDETFGNGNNSKMSIVQQTLYDAVMAFHNAINFGYQEFPGTINNCSVQGCCARSNTDQNTIPPGGSTLSAIQTQLSTCRDGNANNCIVAINTRPIADALHNATRLLSDVQHEESILIVVDGPPSCSMETEADACLDARLQMGALYNDGKVTGYVLQVGGAAPDGCLMTLAAAGGTSLKWAQVPQQLTTIVSDVLSLAAAPACEIQINPPNDPNRVQVQIGSQPPLSPDTWSYGSPNNNLIEVHGTAACVMLQGLGSNQNNQLQVYEKVPCQP